MRLKNPAQPLVFYFSGVSPLCGAVAEIYETYPEGKASLCLYRDRYFLAVYASFGMRSVVRKAVGEQGVYLGAGKVLYSFLEEHGRCISGNAIGQLGAALHRDGAQ